MESQFVNINIENYINSCSNKNLEINNMLKERTVIVHFT